MFGANAFGWAYLGQAYAGLVSGPSIVITLPFEISPYDDTHTAPVAVAFAVGAKMDTATSPIAVNFTVSPSDDQKTGAVASVFDTPTPRLT